MPKKARSKSQPEEAVALPAPPADTGEADVFRQLHTFQSTGLIGLKTAAVAALATTGQPLAGLFRPNRTLVSEHLRGWLEGATHITAERARELASRLDMSTQQLMLELIPVARGHARAAVSNYRVGVVGRGNSGDLYLGFNMEFPEIPLSGTVHAEQAVVVIAMAHREKGLSALASSFAPSGHSRQFLYEIPGGGDLKVILPGRTLRLKALLPSNFGPQDLGIQGALMSSPRHSLAPLKATSDPLVLQALEAASRAYTPYSHCPSGVALLAGSHIVTGSYCENAAFNPSLSPLQAALINLTAQGREYSELRRVVLVERQKMHPNQVLQEGATRMLLSALAPEVKLEVVHVRGS